MSGDGMAELLGQFATEGGYTSNYSAEPSGGRFTYQTLCEMLEKVRDAPMWVSAQQQQASAEMIHERLDRWYPGWRERYGVEGGSGC